MSASFICICPPFFHSLLSFSSFALPFQSTLCNVQISDRKEEDEEEKETSTTTRIRQRGGRNHLIFILLLHFDLLSEVSE
ncbi:MAG: hypothetical protein J3R72DRAFT_431815 [Linnemannia gamsii]|nr:MAG: hypothetical protein J3R72DRAFT_431815 [Linnemannia gamsii]